MDRMTRAANYQEAEHNADYEAVYKKQLITGKTFVYNTYRHKMSLDGTWRFEVDMYDSSLRSKWFQFRDKDDDGFYNAKDFTFSEWEKIKVPACWNMQSERYFFYEGTGIYTREFICRLKADERIVLKFGAANYSAMIFLNGVYLGMHQGGFTPFFVEVTEYLQENNRIIVAVNNQRRKERVPAQMYDWYNYGGLFRSIEILRLPKVFINRFHAALVPDGTFRHIRIRVQVDGTDSGTAAVQIPELNLAAEIPIHNCCGEAVLDAAPELWHPGNPKLYRITCSFADDFVEDRVGFREIKTVGTELHLNGKKIILKGTTFHEDSVKNGRSLTEEEMRENFALAKELNCNFVRLNHYPHHELAAQIADELGILLWEEIPAFWAIDFDNPWTCQDAQNQLSELVLRDINRASVIIWCVCNENEDTDSRLKFAVDMMDTARRLDPDRLVTAACMFDSRNHRIVDRVSKYVDLICVNQYYGWYQNDIEKLPVMLKNLQEFMDRPAIISEFGADGGPGWRGFDDEKGTEDYQRAVYCRQVEELGKADFLCGTISWLMYDFRTPRRLHISQQQPNGEKRYNVKGVLSADKKHRKLAFNVLRDFYANR